MAINEENDLIGYDPLAWMGDDSAVNENVADDERSNKELDKPLLINDESNADDYSDDFMEDVEESAAVMEEDGSIKDDVEFASDNALMEEDSGNTNSGASEDAVSENEGGSDVVPLELADAVEGQIDLDAVLSIQHVVKLHENLKNALAIYNEIEINASDVSSIDTSTLQLLVSLKKDAVKLQKKVTIIYPSPRFVESAKLLGLLDVLEVYDV